MAESDKNDLLVSESLATKYRPKTLKDLVGQEAVKRQLQGMLNKGIFKNAILITGKAGTGKTTIANLIVRYVNCETLDACGKCESCKKVKHPDLFEVNVGTTGGKDDVRAIINSATFMPNFNKRVILLDECHLFTKQAESALLIPLEKPSKNTIFVLATTNPEKVLPTILSRCVRFELKPIEEEVLAKRMYKIAKLEGYDLNEYEKGVDALDYIASVSRGQMRDAIQMLDSLLMALEGSDDEDVDAYHIVSNLIGNDEASADQSAAEFLFAMQILNLPLALKQILRIESPRLLLSKTRWLIQNTIDDLLFAKERKETGKKRWDSYAEKAYKEILASANRKFAKKGEPEVKVIYSDLLVIQNLLSKAEMNMNSFPIDEKVLMCSLVGEYLEHRLKHD